MKRVYSLNWSTTFKLLSMPFVVRLKTVRPASIFAIAALQ